MVVVLVAAGKGSRIKSKEKKQYLQIGGKPVLVRTLVALGRIAELDPIVVVVGEEDVEKVQQYAEQFQEVPRRLKVVKGGAERRQSVYNGLKALENDQVEYVLVMMACGRLFLRRRSGLVWIRLNEAGRLCWPFR